MNDASEDDRIPRPIFWIVVASSIATAFYSVILSNVPDPTSGVGRWPLAVLASVIFNWITVHCAREGGRLNLFASYLMGVFYLVGNVVLAIIAFSVLLGSGSALFVTMHSSL
jgi:hypothetical protein